MSARTERLESWQYTVEPGVDECRAKLNPAVNGGGIGSMDSLGTKYYDFYHYKRTPGSLRHFLETLTSVEDDVTYYCATSYNAIKSYVSRYLSLFVPAEKAREIIAQCEWHSRTHRHDEEASFLYRTVAVGTRFFNEIFYETSWEVAESLFPSTLLSNCLDAFSRKYQGTANLPAWKLFINYFDSDCFEFHLSQPIDKVIVPRELRRLRWEPWRFECSELDYEKSFKPFILFLSNWTLLLLCLLAGEKFGQVAFGIYWETGVLAHRF